MCLFNLHSKLYELFAGRIFWVATTQRDTFIRTWYMFIDQFETLLQQSTQLEEKNVSKKTVEG